MDNGIPSDIDLSQPVDAWGRLVASFRRHPVWFAAAAHLLFALFLFSPFLLRGRVLIGSTDNYFAMLPNTLFSLRTIQQGDPGLWNPYLLGGINFVGSTHNHLYSPLNWPLFAMPESWFFSAFTIRVLLEVWMVGLFAFLFFREELADTTWALFGSLVYQAGGYTLFSLTTYSNTQLYMLVPLALYVIWSLARRPRWRSFVYLAGIFTVALMTGNIVYAAGAGLIILVLLCYRCRVLGWRAFGLRGPVWIFFAAGVTALLLSAVRWVPVVTEITQGARIETVGVRVIGLRAFAISTVAVPKTFGVTIGQSIPIFRAFGDGGHGQFHAYPYFGAIPLLLVCLGVALQWRQLRFWLVFLLLSACWLLAVQPLSVLLDILFYPLIHTIIAKTLIPIPFCIVAAKVGQHLQARGEATGKGIWWLGGVVAGFALLTVGVSAVGLQRLGVAEALKAGRMLAVGTVAVVLAATGAMLARASIRRVAVATVVLLLAAGYLGLCWLAHSYGLLSVRFFRSSVLFTATSTLGAIAALLAIEFGSRALLRPLGKPVIVGILVAVFGVLFAIRVRNPSEFPHLPSVPLLTAMGLLKFIALGLACASLMAWWRREPRAGSLVPLFLAGLLLIDLLPYNKDYSRQIASCFQRRRRAYPVLHAVSSGSTRQGVGPNLLTNASFEQWDARQRPTGWVASGNFQQLAPMVDGPVRGRSSLVLANAGRNTPNFYQDYTGPRLAAEKTYTFGIWARVAAGTEGSVRLSLNDRRAGVLSSPATGTGQWQWLQATFTAGDDPQYLRSHISLTGPVEVAVDAAVLVEGLTADPFDDALYHPDEPLVSGFQGVVPKPIVLDLKNYRVNHPHGVLFGHAQESETNLPMYYGVRMYGGLNSDVRPELLKLLRTLEPTGQFVASGATASANCPRLLDLLGCRYDLDANRRLIERPGALSRFAMFYNVAILKDNQAALAKISSPSFVPLRQVVVTDPGRDESTKASSLETVPALPYQQVATGDLRLTVDVAEDAVLFFGDVYHPGWQVTVDGQARPLLRTDYCFMGVTVPKGRHTVAFTFFPPALRRGISMSIAGVGVLLMLTLTLALVPLFRRRG